MQSTFIFQLRPTDLLLRTALTLGSDFRSGQFDVGAVAPHLRRGLAVVTEPENVFAWLEGRGDLHDVAHRVSAPVDARAPGARLGESRTDLVPVRLDAAHLRVARRQVVAGRVGDWVASWVGDSLRTILILSRVKFCAVKFAFNDIGHVGVPKYRHHDHHRGHLVRAQSQARATTDLVAARAV